MAQEERTFALPPIPDKHCRHLKLNQNVMNAGKKARTDLLVERHEVETQKSTDMLAGFAEEASQKNRPMQTWWTRHQVLDASSTVGPCFTLSECVCEAREARESFKHNIYSK